MGRISLATVLIFAVLTTLGAVLAGSAMGDDTSPSPETSASSDPSRPLTDDAAAIGEILEQIAAQQEEIFSATIKYRWHLASYRRAENTPDRVHALLAEYDLTENPDSLRELVRALVPEPATIDPPWETRTFQMLGDKRRADTSQNVIQLVDGEHEMTYEGSNEQLTIGHLGKSNVHLTEITDFRSYLPSPPGGLTAADLRVAERQQNEVILEMLLPSDAPNGMLPSRYTVDRTTGIVTHSETYVEDRLSREVWQSALMEYPGGIVMPAVRVATLYRDGRLNTLRVFIIEEADFNGPVPEEQFVMPVAAGTVLVDHRHPSEAIWRAKNPADDVRSMLVPVSAPVATVSGGSGPSWQMVLILNGAVLLILATVLWRRSSLPRVPPTKPHRS